MLVNNVTLEHLQRDNVTVAVLNMLDKQTCAVEGLVTSEAGEFLVDFVVQLYVSFQTGGTLELIATDAAC